MVTGSNWGQPRQPAWVLNLLADPAATVWIGGTRIPVRGEEATGAERDRLWRPLVAAWPAYQTYRQRAGDRETKIFRLTPLP